MSDEATRPRPAIELARIAALLVIYVGFGAFSLGISFRRSSEVLVWLPSGLSLAALILFGWRLWPGVLVGAVVVGAMQGLAPLLAAAVAAGTTLEAVGSSIVLRRFLDFRPSLDRLRDVVALLLVAGVIGSGIGALVEVTPLWHAGYFASDDFADVYMLWWRAGFAKIVTLTPLILLLWAGRPSWLAVFSNKEFWAVAALLAATCFATFGGVATGEIQSMTIHLPILLVIWAGVRLGSRGAILIAFATFATVSSATRQGLGPLVAHDPGTTLSLVWIYCMGIASTAPIVAAIAYQRDAAESQSLRDTEERLRVEQDGRLLRQKERIMREMHDGLGGQLVSLLSMVQRGQAKPEEITEVLRCALDDMRFMLDSMEPGEEGLAGMLEKFRVRIEPVLRRNGLTLGWRIDDACALERIGPTESLHCLRIIQEAVTNTIQHAHASRVQIAISPSGNRGSMLSFEVSDDGGVGPLDVATRGLGMRNMVERAREVGAEIHFEDMHPGRRVRVEIPIPERSRLRGVESADREDLPAQPIESPG